MVRRKESGRKHVRYERRVELLGADCPGNFSDPTRAASAASSRSRNVAGARMDSCHSKRFGYKASAADDWEPVWDIPEQLLGYLSTDSIVYRVASHTFIHMADGTVMMVMEAPLSYLVFAIRRKDATSSSIKILGKVY